MTGRAHLGTKLMSKCLPGFWQMVGGNWYTPRPWRACERGIRGPGTVSNFVFYWGSKGKNR